MTFTITTVRSFASGFVGKVKRTDNSTWIAESAWEALEFWRAANKNSFQEPKGYVQLAIIIQPANQLNSPAVAEMIESTKSVLEFQK